jgi:hypothetical protein
MAFVPNELHRRAGASNRADYGTATWSTREAAANPFIAPPATRRDRELIRG